MPAERTETCIVCGKEANCKLKGAKSEVSLCGECVRKLAKGVKKGGK